MPVCLSSTHEPIRRMWNNFVVQRPRMRAGRSIRRFLYPARHVMVSQNEMTPRSTFSRHLSFFQKCALNTTSSFVRNRGISPLRSHIVLTRPLWLDAKAPSIILLSMNIWWLGSAALATENWTSPESGTEAGTESVTLTFPDRVTDIEDMVGGEGVDF